MQWNYRLLYSLPEIVSKYLEAGFFWKYVWKCDGYCTHLILLNNQKLGGDVATPGSKLTAEMMLRY